MRVPAARSYVPPGCENAQILTWVNSWTFCYGKEVLDITAICYNFMCYWIQATPRKSCKIVSKMKENPFCWTAENCRKLRQIVAVCCASINLDPKVSRNVQVGLPQVCAQHIQQKQVLELFQSQGRAQRWGSRKQSGNYSISGLSCLFRFFSLLIWELGVQVRK